jgi:Uma2 family endonuclease
MAPVLEDEEEAEVKLGQPITEEELMRLPDDGFLYELVDGRLAGQPCKSFLAGIITVNIVGLMGLYVRGHGIMTLGKAGFRMANGNIRVPSTSYTRKERFPGGHSPDGFADLAADLCVEIISPSERKADMARKVREYFDGGTVQVWHVFPERQEVIVFTSPTETQTLDADGILDAGGLLPGFSCRVADLFILE